MSIVEEMIGEIESTDEAEIMEFDFNRCFTLMREMEYAMSNFVNRVDKGEVKSTFTYRQFKSILKM